MFSNHLERPVCSPLGTMKIDCAEEQFREMNFNTVQVNSVSGESLNVSF